MNAPDTGDRVGAFCVGLAVAAVCAFLACVLFGLLTMMANPARAETDWATIRERAQSNPAITAFLALCCVGALFGVALMWRAAFGKPRS